MNPGATSHPLKGNHQLEGLGSFQSHEPASYRTSKLSSESTTSPHRLASLGAQCRQSSNPSAPGPARAPHPRPRRPAARCTCPKPSRWLPVWGYHLRVSCSRGPIQNGGFPFGVPLKPSKKGHQRGGICGQVSGRSISWRNPLLHAMLVGGRVPLFVWF